MNDRNTRPWIIFLLILIYPLGLIALCLWLLHRTQYINIFQPLTRWTRLALILFWPVGLAFVLLRAVLAGPPTRISGPTVFSVGERKAQPLIDAFVHAYIPGEARWPQRVDIPSEDIEALQTIIVERVHVIIDYARLSRLVSDTLLQKQTDLFWGAFEQTHPNLNRDSRTSDLVSAYVDTFGQNTEFIPHLVGRTRDLNMFLRAYHEEIEKRVRLQRVNTVAMAMERGGPVSKRITMSEIDLVSGVEFEDFLSTLFSRMGYSCTTTKASGDQGADLLLEKLGERLVVQAKRYSEPVGNKAVQEAIAARVYYSCNKAMVVTTSTFTAAALDLAHSAGVSLVDRKRLGELISLHLY